VLALVASHNQVIFYGGYMLAVITAVLLAPALSLWIARAIRPALAWMRPWKARLRRTA
jgi:hypothetical protein